MAKENVANTDAERAAALKAASAEPLMDESGVESLDVQVIKRAAYRKNQDHLPRMSAKYETLVNMGCEDCMLDAEGAKRRYDVLPEASRPAYFVDVDVRRMVEKFDL
jgi:hypothetical protein